jgi:hypothetical protein
LAAVDVQGGGGQRRKHIIPVLGARPLNTHLGQILAAAVEDGLVPRNPAAGARMPKAEAARPEPVPAEVAEVSLPPARRGSAWRSLSWVGSVFARASWPG